MQQIISILGFDICLIINIRRAINCLKTKYIVLYNVLIIRIFLTHI